MKTIILSTSAAALTVATMSAAAWCNGSSHNGPFASPAYIPAASPAVTMEQRQAMADQHRAMAEQHAKAMQQMMDDQRKMAEQWTAQLPQMPEMPPMPAFGERPTMPEMPPMPAFGERPTMPEMPPMPAFGERPAMPQMPEFPAFGQRPTMGQMPQTSELPAFEMPELPEFPAMNMPQVSMPEYPGMPEMPAGWIFPQCLRSAPRSKSARHRSIATAPRPRSAALRAVRRCRTGSRIAAHCRPRRVPIAWLRCQSPTPLSQTRTARNPHPRRRPKRKSLNRRPQRLSNILR